MLSYIVLPENPYIIYEKTIPVNSTGDIWTSVKCPNSDTYITYTTMR